MPSQFAVIHSGYRRQGYIRLCQDNRVSPPALQSYNSLLQHHNTMVTSDKKRKRDVSAAESTDQIKIVNTEAFGLPPVAGLFSVLLLRGLNS